MSTAITLQEKEIPIYEEGKQYNVAKDVLEFTSSLWVQKMETMFRVFDSEGKGVFLVEQTAAQKQQAAIKLGQNNAKTIYTGMLGAMKTFYFAGCMSINKAGQLFVVFKDFVNYMYYYFIKVLGRKGYLEQNRVVTQPIFDAFDKNDDNKLSMKEVSISYAAMGINEHNTRIAFAAMDKDNNGSVSFDEMLEAYTGFFFDMKFTSNALMYGSLGAGIFKAE